jgi:hypothetical protein
MGFGSNHLLPAPPSQPTSNKATGQVERVLKIISTARMRAEKLWLRCFTP